MRLVQQLNAKQAFEMLLLRKECILNKNNCDKDCSSCKYNIESTSELLLIDYLIEILKNREPTLHFCNQSSVLLELLNRRIKDETKSQEIE